MTRRKSPLPEVVRLRREEAGLTQVEAADLIHVHLDSFRSYERGRTEMSAAHWELFLIKTRKFVRRGGN